MFLEILKAILMGIVEGITEWLPISSTGHMILVEQVVKFNASEEFMSMFRVVIQLGAILAVVVLFWNKLWPFGLRHGRVCSKPAVWQLWFKVVAATMPQLAPGAIVLAHDIHPWTIKAVPTLIEKIRAKGYTLVSLDDILGPTTPGKTYTRGLHP